MPTIKTDVFGGILPKVHPTLLPEGCAVRAHNCRLHSGKLVPLRQPSRVSANLRLENGLARIADAKSIYLWHGAGRSEWLAWPGIVTVARGNIADDELRRVFVSGDTGIGGDGKNEPGAYITSKDGLSFTRHSLVKASLPAPVVTRTQGTPLDENNRRFTYFFQTWADKYGYESAPSPRSTNPAPAGDENEDGDFIYNDGDEVSVAEIPTADTPAGAVKRKIYKAIAGSGPEADSIMLIAQQDILGLGFQEFVFRVKDEDAVGSIPMFQSPPGDLDLMTYVSGGFYAGISRSRPRTVMFSDTNIPTSWPVAYTIDVPDNIVSIAVVGNTVYVLTDGCPRAVSGLSPDTMADTGIPSPQACVSPRSVCVMENAAFYASHDGIVMLSPELGASAKVITEQHFGKDEWTALNPASCIMAGYDGALHAWFRPNGSISPQGYIIDLRAGKTAAITTHDERAKAVHYDPETDGLYYVREV